MSEVGDMYKELQAASRVKRAANRQSSAQLLTDAGIDFDSKNGGAHLIIEADDNFIDFWPGTGLWKVRNDGRKGRGVKSLLDLYFAEFAGERFNLEKEWAR